MRISSLFWHLCAIFVRGVFGSGRLVPMVHFIQNAIASRGIIFCYPQWQVWGKDVYGLFVFETYNIIIKALK